MPDIKTNMWCQALEAVGVDPRELTEADEFFGTAALKSYNTFVRPRTKQLQKVDIGGKGRVRAGQGRAGKDSGAGMPAYKVYNRLVQSLSLRHGPISTSQ